MKEEDLKKISEIISKDIHTLPISKNSFIIKENVELNFLEKMYLDSINRELASNKNSCNKYPHLLQLFFLRCFRHVI